MNISKNTKLTKALAGAVAGTSELTTAVINMEGFEGVEFFGSIATKDPTNYIKVQQGKLLLMTDAEDLKGTKLATTVDGNVFLTDIYKPQEQYVQLVVTRAVSTTVGDIFALQYAPKKMPVTQPTTIEAETHISPEEGTA